MGKPHCFELQADMPFARNRYVLQTESQQGMFQRLFSRTPKHEVPQQLYGKVVEQSRQPAFFTDFGFPDTVSGRFDVLCLHMFLFSRRLVREDTRLSADLNQEVFDAFVQGTDSALRELGVGDTSVPKRKKKMVRSFYATVDEFAGPMDAGDQNALADAVANRYQEMRPDEAPALAKYMLAAAETLDTQSAQAIMSGELHWPSVLK